jgi:sugar-specific transcriptional regulator TrmB
MDNSLLEELGLSRNEARTYMTLLRLGRANSAELARESGIHRINVYDVLNSLISKGLVSYITEGGTRTFKPESPEKLKEKLDAKSAMLARVLPSLMQEFSARKEPFDVSILRGVEGKRSQFEEIARAARNTENRIFVPHGLTSMERPPYNTMLINWFERLARQNVSSKLIIMDSPGAREKAKRFHGLSKHRVRFSKEIKFSPVSWNVCQDLLFLTFHTEPFLVIRIRSKDIAAAFMNSFDLMWKAAKM